MTSLAEPRVLVVDDDVAVRTMVRHALGRVDVPVVEAPDGDAALALLAAHEVEVVVLDWQMPGSSGLDVLRAIRRAHPEVQVVICTGAGDQDRDVALAAGAVDHITKARPLIELVRLVQSVLAGTHEPAVPGEAPTEDGVRDEIRAAIRAAAHELHNHLTVVLGHNDLARSQIERSGADLPGRDEVLRDLDAVAAASERIGAVSRRLRDLAEGTAGPTGAAGDQDEPGPGPEGPTILLVEDDLDLRSTTERLLREEGYRVLGAPDAATAVELLREHGPVDLCIADLLIPGGGPGDAAAQVAEASPGTPILVMSGYGEDALGSSLAPATVRFLAKPFTRDRLLDAIRDALPG